MTESKHHHGQCLCGSVQFEARGPFRPVIACHCRQCARWTGHYVAATAVARGNIDIGDESNLRWYRSSDEAERGFCQQCGSSMFWRPSEGDMIMIMAGVLDNPSGLRPTHHIFVDDKSDYYDIHDGLPQHAAGKPV